MEPIDPSISMYWDEDEVIDESIYFADAVQEIITYHVDVNGRNYTHQREKVKDEREYFKRKLEGK